MKKIVLSIVFAASAYSINVNAQVGINVASPSSTLDITAKNATGTSKDVDGLLVPRVDRERAQNMTGVPTSTLIFVNSIATGTQTGTAVNIDAVGHYSFNGTAWVKLGTGTGSSVNIYNSDGSLTGNRVVTQGANTLAFNGTAANAFSVDGSTLSVDAANDKVGVGTTSPGVKLDVAQAIGTSEATQLRILNTSPVAVNNTAYMGFNSYNGGGATWGIGSIQNSTSATDSNFHILYSGGASYNKLFTIRPNTGNVGIGTTTPNSKLDLGASVGSSVTDVAGKKLAVYNDAAGTDFYGLGISGGLLQFHAASTAADAPGMVLTGSGNLGVGTTAPTSTLDVSGTARVRTMNVAPGSTLVTPVFSDANGNLVKAASNTYMGVTSTSAVVVGSGATATLINGLTDGGVYRFVVTVGDGCAYNTVMEFFVSTYAANSNFAIRGLNGLLSNGTSKVPTISEPTRTSTVVTWTGKPNCQDGADGNSLNYTVTMPNSSTINVTNNGNVTRQYVAVITRLN